MAGPAQRLPALAVAFAAETSARGHAEEEEEEAGADVPGERLPGVAVPGPRAQTCTPRCMGRWQRCPSGVCSRCRAARSAAVPPATCQVPFARVPGPRCCGEGPVPFPKHPFSRLINGELHVLCSAKLTHPIYKLYSLYSIQ